jgi:L-alanine-DL-glutamate epimerase-like enolase superfamily enzyme
MKIKNAKVLLFRRELDGRTYNPVFRWKERRAPLLVIETDSGARGIGEAWSPHRDIDPVLQSLSQLAALAIDLEIEAPLDRARLFADEKMSGSIPWARAAAVSALDIALWDAFGHEQGKPVWDLLGGSTDVARVYASGGLYKDNYSLNDLATEIQGYCDQGFDAFKMKIAGGPFAVDIDRVKTVKQVIGPLATLWVDAVNQLDFEGARKWCQTLRPIGVSAIQAPLPFSDISGMAALNKDHMPVVAAEAEHDHRRFSELVSSHAVGHLQFCLPLCGGISGGVALDAMAKTAGITSTPQCFSTSIAQAATLHFAAARTNVERAEYHCFHDHLKPLFIGRTGQIAHGCANAGTDPGLGVAIPEVGRQVDGSDVTLWQ